MAKIANVEIPPKQELIGKYFNEIGTEKALHLVREVDPNIHGFDSKGNYLHWDGFIPRAHEFKGLKEAAYIVLRMKRSLKKHANLIDEQSIPFMYTENGLMAKLHEIAQMLTFEHLHGGNFIDKIVHFSHSAAMEEAISSAQLEGAATTRKVAKEMLETGREAKNFSERMIINNWRLIQYADENKIDNLSIELILQFNKIATEKALENGHVAGEIRDGDVFVKNDMTGDVIHQAPSCEHVEKMLHMLCQYANADHKVGGEFIHPIIKSCVIHFMIGYIHPFFDGNGRTARALFYWYMLKSGYENFKFISISSLLKKAPTQYMKSYVFTETDNNDLTHFIDYQLTIIIRALKNFTNYIEEKEKELRKAFEKLKTSPVFNQFSLHHITILEKALKNPGRIFTVKEIENDFNVSSTAARTYLQKLSDMDLLVKVNLKGRTYGYIALNDLRTKLSIAD